MHNQVQPPVSSYPMPFFEVRYGGVRYRLYVGGPNIYVDRSGIPMAMSDDELPSNVQKFRRQLVSSVNSMQQYVPKPPKLPSIRGSNPPKLYKGARYRIR